MKMVCECGRPARFFRRGYQGRKQDKNHTLCRQCYKTVMAKLNALRLRLQPIVESNPLPVLVVKLAT